MAICGLLMIGSLLVPYVRARAESQGLSCEVGLAERAERVIIFAGGLILGIEVAAIWILTILTHLTVIQRLLYVRAQFQEEREIFHPAPPDSEELIVPDVKGDS